MWQNLQHWDTEYQHLWIWVGSVSLLLFICSILALPWLVSQIPQDYFIRPKRPFLNQNISLSGVVLLLIKNIFGFILIFLGILMLLLPGQGLLTILAGVLLADFPGKFAFEKWLISQKGVFDTINWLRTKRNIPPLLSP